MERIFKSLSSEDQQLLRNEVSKLCDRFKYEKMDQQLLAQLQVSFDTLISHFFTSRDMKPPKIYVNSCLEMGGHVHVDDGRPDPELDIGPCPYCARLKRLGDRGVEML